MYSLYWTCILSTRFEWNKLLTMPGEYIYQDDVQSTAYNRICSDSIDETIKTYVRIITMEILSFVIAAIGPLYNNINYGTKSTFYCVRLPYINANPDMEFLMNFSWESIGAILYYIGSMGIQLIFIIIIDAITVSSRLCELRLNELSGNLEKKRGTEKQRRQQLRVIMMQTKFIDR